MDDLRYLGIMADGVRLEETNRIHITGRSTMSLQPDLYQVQIYNLSAAGLAAIRHADNVTILGKRDSILCSCKPSDIIQTVNGAQQITTLMMIDGEEFWSSTVSLTIRGGTDYLTAIRTILAHSSHNTPLAAVPETHLKTLKGLTIYGRTSEQIDRFARALGCRAYIFRNTINLARIGEGTTETLLAESDMLEEPASGDGVTSICTDVIGMMVGRRITVSHPRAGGVWRLVAQRLDADNWSGPWRSDLVMINETSFTAGWDGGI